MPKQYAQQTKQFLTSNGLVRVWTRDAATGEEKLRQVPHKEAERLECAGKVLRKD